MLDLLASAPTSPAASPTASEAALSVAASTQATTEDYTADNLASQLVKDNLPVVLLTLLHSTPPMALQVRNRKGLALWTLAVQHTRT